MTITLKPETEQLITEDLQKGHFNSVDEIILEGVQASRGKEPLPLSKVFRLAGATKTPAEAIEAILNRLPPVLPFGTSLMRAARESIRARNSVTR